MKNSDFNNFKPEKTDGLTRRKWFKKVSVPALLTLGAGIISSPASAFIPSNELDISNDAESGTKIFNIKNFGAKGDGKTLDTLALQKAIDACHNDNGGTVLIPAGDFVIGTTELKSNVTLHLSVNARLLGSAKNEHYSAGKGVPAGNGNIVLLYAANAKNVTIEGNGTIDGNGAAFYNGQGDNTGPNSKGGGYFGRPHLLVFYKCDDLRLRDAFFTKSAYHCCRILHCEQVDINGIRIYNRVNKNNDGFHFNDCKYVRISNCEVRCQDDACALFGSNQFVTVTNCSFSTRWSVFRFGGGEAQNIAISNCLIYETYGCPIKISTGKGKIENLSFSNIIMRNVTGPIGIGFTGNNKKENDVKATTEFFVRNISFNGIRASVVPRPINHPDIPFDVNVYDGESNSCITLNGVGDSYLENISFSDVEVIYAGGGTKEQAAKRNVPLVSAEYFGVWTDAPGGPPAYGLYARNVKSLKLSNIRFSFENDDQRPAVIFDNVQDAAINGLSVMGSLNAESSLRIINSKDVFFSALRILTPAKVLLSLEGSKNEGIIIDGGDLRKAEQKFVLLNAATQKELIFKL